MKPTSGAIGFRTHKIVLARNVPKNDSKANAILPISSFAKVKQNEEDTSSLLREEKREPQVETQPEVKREFFSTKNSSLSSKESLPSLQREMLEARDRCTIVPFVFQGQRFSFENDKKSLDAWLGEMLSRVISVSFNFLISHELSFQEVKIYCSENILLNTLSFIDKFNTQRKQKGTTLETAQLIKYIDSTMVRSLEYLLVKYPQTKQTKPNKVLREKIDVIDNISNDEYDLISKSSIEFKEKPDGNYIRDIMQFINFILNRQDQIDENANGTLFEEFYSLMEKIFSIVFLPQNENFETQRLLQIIKQRLKSEDLKVVQYFRRVKEYTDFKIGRKIPSESEKYTEQEIQFQNFHVKNSSILRMLTKWSEELSRKLTKTEETFLQRTFRFKKNTKNDYTKLSNNQKYELYQEAKLTSNKISVFEKQMKESLNFTEAMITKSIGESYKMLHIPKDQFYVGYFSSKVQMAASSALIANLNNLIHSLLAIPEKIKREHYEDQDYQFQMDINLVTFKIGDLFRCNCKSHETEIVRIFEVLKQINDSKPELLKIVRINDRLEKSTSDILINVLFKGVFLAEIQLAVTDQTQEKQKTLDKFNHFLYELRRSELGPIMELGCIWAQFDQRSQVFRNISNKNSKNPVQASKPAHRALTMDKSQLDSPLKIHQKYSKIYDRKIAHSCGEEELSDYIYSFVCTLCANFIHIPSNLIKHQRCMKCKVHFQCSDCLFNLMSDAQIKRLFKLNEIIGPFLEDFRLWKPESIERNITYPEYGLIASKKIKNLKLTFFHTINFKGNIYLVSINEESKISIINKFANSIDGWIQLCQSYILFQWTEKRFINRNVLPEKLLNQKKAEKEKQETEALKRKAEKEKKKLQLEELRAKMMNKIKGEDKEEEEEDKEKTDDKSKKKKKKQIIVKEQTQQRPATAVQKQIIYYDRIEKCNNNFPFRVAFKESAEKDEYLVLSTYMKLSEIRSQLKNIETVNNFIDRLQKPGGVLFLEDEYLKQNLQSNINEEELMRRYKVQSVAAQKIKSIEENLALITEVYLNNNRLSDISLLSNMKKLKVVHASFNSLTSLNGLQQLYYLTEIIAQQNTISSISALKSSNLIEINLNQNCISDISPFAEFTTLQILLLSSNEIQDMSLLKAPNNRLKRIDLSYNQIAAIVPYSQNVIEELDLASNRIADLQHIRTFINLKKLNLNRNIIASIHPQILELKSLVKLDMDSNQLRAIDGLCDLPNLKILHLDNNSIGIVKGLHLKSLQRLHLSFNMISDILEDIDLAEIPLLRVLDLTHNCVQFISDQFVESVFKDLKNQFKLKITKNPIDLNLNARAIKKLNKKHCDLEIPSGK